LRVRCVERCVVLGRGVEICVEIETTQVPTRLISRGGCNTSR
jgi:hypothetical protein